MRTRLLAGTFAAIATLVITGVLPASGHEEREITFPDGTGSVPEYRTAEQASEVLVVCPSDKADFEQRLADFPADLKQRNVDLFAQCQDDGFTSVQDAVDAVTRPGTNIYLLPGEYTEDEYRGDPTGQCANLDRPMDASGSYQVLEFDDHVLCPHNQNLIAVLDIDELQIEGTGAEPDDVVIDAGFTKLNALRLDRSDGIYLKNFTAQQTTFNAIYILETDGFVIDDAIGRWNDEYGFLTFGSDHGLYTDCEAYGNGDSGIYPGSASNINEHNGYEMDRHSIEIRNCYSHHNLLGYSGTAGNSVWAHDNDFSSNAVGLAMDSLFPSHPGLPQNHSRFEDNLIYNNNEDYYRYVRDGTCAKDPIDRGYQDGVVCPAIGVPPGTGLLTAGGNYNVFRGNHVFGNDYTGFLLLHPPSFVRNEYALTKQWDTSNHNSYIGNVFGESPDGKKSPNGLDVWWDGQGKQNCWQSDVGESVPRELPECGAQPGQFEGPQSARLFAEPATLASLYVCSEYDLAAARIPAGCEWLGASGVERLDVQLTLASSVLVGLVGLLLWFRRLRRSVLAGIATIVGLAGLVLNVIVVPRWETVWPAVALTMIGAWLVVLGVVLIRERHRKFGWLTAIFGLFGLLHAVDKAILLLPWTPLSPAWFRLLVGIVWVIAGVVLVARRQASADEHADVASDVDGTAPAPA